ncbi:MAG: hypothetical protein KGI89_10845, partial [Euryarchaeota archaeon]|nr:hypothetical protein [Euryarchaeota archaeon]
RCDPALAAQRSSADVCSCPCGAQALEVVEAGSHATSGGAPGAGSTTCRSTSGLGPTALHPSPGYPSIAADFSRAVPPAAQPATRERLASCASRPAVWRRGLGILACPSRDATWVTPTSSSRGPPDPGS